jgi:hypothetical protein
MFNLIRIVHENRFLQYILFWKYFSSKVHECSYLFKLETLRLDIRFCYYKWTLSIRDDFHYRYEYKLLDYNVWTTNNTLIELQCFQTLFWKCLSSSFYCVSFMGFARYNGNGMHFVKKKKSIAWEKFNLTVYLDNKYACAKSIFIDCNIAITSKFDFETHTQVCVVANYKTQKERCHVNFFLLHPCRLWSPLSSSSKTLSKHIHSAHMFRFCFHSICGAVGISETACRAILELPNRAHLNYTSFGLSD